MATALTSMKSKRQEYEADADVRWRIQLRARRNAPLSERERRWNRSAE